MFHYINLPSILNSAGLKPLAAPPFPYVAKRIYMTNKNCYIQIAIFPCKYFGANIFIFALIRTNHLAWLVKIYSLHL